jgi:hypothetical protein
VPALNALAPTAAPVRPMAAHPPNPMVTTAMTRMTRIDVTGAA